MLVPESAGRLGAFPEFIRCDSAWQEWNCLVERQGKGRALSDMAVIYRTTSQGKEIERVLAQADIPYQSGVSSSKPGALYGEKDLVKVVSMHSSKGLEFGLVMIPCLGRCLKKASRTPMRHACYVAMTRAIDRLVMTYRETSSFTRQVQDAISKVSRSLEVA